MGKNKLKAERTSLKLCYNINKQRKSKERMNRKGTIKTRRDLQKQIATKRTAE